MKSILYVGATLMIGASIYGFVDYKKTVHQKEFQQMYDAKDVKPAADGDKTHATVLNQQSNINVKIANKEKKSIAVDEPIVEENVVPNKKSGRVTKKLNYKLFSRAPLERRYLEKDIKIEDLKISEPGKIITTDSLTENKKQ